jgi:hypothetical protein
MLVTLGVNKEESVFQRWNVHATSKLICDVNIDNDGSPCFAARLKVVYIANRDGLVGTNPLDRLIGWFGKSEGMC